MLRAPPAAPEGFARARPRGRLPPGRLERPESASRASSSRSPQKSLWRCALATATYFASSASRGFGVFEEDERRACCCLEEPPLGRRGARVDEVGADDREPRGGEERESAFGFGDVRAGNPDGRRVATPRRSGREREKLATPPERDDDQTARARAPRDATAPAIASARRETNREVPAWPGNGPGMSCVFHVRRVSTRLRERRASNAQPPRGRTKNKTTRGRENEPSGGAARPIRGAKRAGAAAGETRGPGGKAPREATRAAEAPRAARGRRAWASEWGGREGGREVWRNF